MDSIEQILDDAERLLEGNRFSEACDHFRHALLVAKPNSKILTN